MNILDVKIQLAHNMSRTIDLDIDIGADAVDYKYASSSLFHITQLTYHSTAQ